MASSAWAVKLLAAVGADLRGASFSLLDLRTFANYCTKKKTNNDNNNNNSKSSSSSSNSSIRWALGPLDP